MRVMLIMGPPGVGKGTVSALLQSRLGFRHISTGSLLREAVLSETDLGLQAKEHMRRGELVPDTLMVALMEEQFDRYGDGDYLLDGFPRTQAQARMLDQGLTRRGARIDTVLELEAPGEVVLNRLAGRRLCDRCGEGYHVTFLPPQTPGTCDRCGGMLIQRSDDREEAIARRLVVYASQMEELRPYYRDRGVLFPVRAVGTPEQTEAGILKVMGRG
jgi:adenylate kinase